LDSFVRRLHLVGERLSRSHLCGDIPLKTSDGLLESFLKRSALPNDRNSSDTAHHHDRITSHETSPLLLHSRLQSLDLTRELPDLRFLFQSGVIVL